MRRLGSAGLGYGQVVFLVLGFLFASGLIFLFGIWVGRDVTERRLAREERVVRLPVPERPTPSEEAKEREVDVAFYAKLKEKAQQLQGTAAAASPTAARVAQVATPTVTPMRIAQKPTPVPTATRRPKPAPSPAPHATESSEEWADAGWTVQVNATTDVHQALEVARGLKAKGYDAYTVQAPTRGQVWYRVRVGRFSSRDKAKDLEKRLRTSEGFENAYVAPQ
jgi:cell division septation protein DedD